MSYQDTEPASEGVTPEIRYGDIELDKSQDGRYWQVVYWPDDTVVLRLRIVHSCCEDPSDFVAEAKVLNEDDPAGRSDEEFQVLSRFMCAPVEFELDTEPDVDEFPDMYRAEFITMVRYWGRVTAIRECGAALGDSAILSNPKDRDTD